MSSFWKNSFEQSLESQLSLDAKELEALSSQEDFASVALGLIDANGGPGIVFIKRKLNPLDPWSGHMALPGGRTHFGEDPFMTAVRECHEEIGLRPHGRSFLLPSIEARARSLKQGFSIYPCAFLYEHSWGQISQHIRLCPDEVESVHFFSLKQLLDPSAQSSFLWQIKRDEVELPCLNVEDKVIWGITYTILEQFFQLIEGHIILAGESELKIDLRHWKKHPVL